MNNAAQKVPQKSLLSEEEEHIIGDARIIHRPGIKAVFIAQQSCNTKQGEVNRRKPLEIYE